MAGNHSNLLRVHQEAFDELYVIETLVKLTKSSCLDKEFQGQYYGIPQDVSLKLSAERNQYINMLTVLSEKVSNLMDLNICMEKEITGLQQNSDDCC